MRSFLAILIALCAFSFSSTANAATEMTFTKTVLDPTKGVSVTTKLYANAETKKNIAYYSIRKLTETVKIMDGRTYIRGINVKLGQTGPYIGGIAMNQIKTQKIGSSNFSSFTVYPDANWKLVARYQKFTVVGSNTTIDLQRGASKWSFINVNNVP